MHRAIKRDAVNREMFYFRKSLVPEGDEEEELITDNKETAAATPPIVQSLDHEYTLMSINTIINGKVSQL